MSSSFLSFICSHFSFCLCSALIYLLSIYLSPCFSLLALLSVSLLAHMHIAQYSHSASWTAEIRLLIGTMSTVPGAHSSLLYLSWAPGATSAGIKTAESWSWLLLLSISDVWSVWIFMSTSPRPLAQSLHAVTFRLGDKILHMKFWFLTAIIVKISVLLWWRVSNFATPHTGRQNPPTRVCSPVVFYMFPHFVLDCFCQLVCFLLF